MAEDGYATLDDHLNATTTALSAHEDGAQVAGGETAEADDGAVAPDVATPPPSPATSAPPVDALQALAPVIAQAVAQAMAPMFERLGPAPSSAPTPAPAKEPDPWTLDHLAAMRSPIPEHASEYTREQIASARAGLARWEPVLNDTTHPSHADAGRHVKLFRAELQRAHHVASLEQRLEQQASEIQRLVQAPQQTEMQTRAAAVLRDAAQLQSFPALAAAVQAGADYSHVVAEVDWSQPTDKALGDLARLLRVLDRSVASAKSTAPVPPPASVPTPASAAHNPAHATPPRPAPAAGVASEGYLSLADHIARAERGAIKN